MELRDTAKAADGRELAVTRFPAEGKAWATLLLAGAMGVRQDFYEPLARFLAESGIHVLTFDYRGMGASRDGSLRGLDADVLTWADADLEAMLAEARAMGPGLKALALGHSLGGQLFGSVPEGARLDAFVTVTAGTGWYRHNDRMAWQVRFFWFVAIPLLTPLFGYFPGKRLRMVGDLPAGVARQWRRWALHPEYLLSEGEAMRGRFDAVRAPVLGFSFEDDAIITKPAVDQLHGFYRHARVERRHLAPADAGRRRIGHFGYFQPESRDNLWRDTLAWLKEHA
ncbi:MAG: alpha/beta fold hydrolase [Burkholderiales bacterium]|nr:alpha/beta fold hydrolase [Burkholderiales bacterium]MBZ0250265.1 alpha/beta fold hydrolase [Burkholderiales bacterium]